MARLTKSRRDRHNSKTGGGQGTSSPQPQSTPTIWPLVDALLALPSLYVTLINEFPIVLTLTFYALALTGFLHALRRWTTSKCWGAKRALATLSLAGCLCLFLMSIPLWGRYERWAGTAVSFKSSPSFTWWRRQKIRYRIARFRDYLTSLDIVVPNTLPPFAVNTQPHCSGGGGFVSPNVPLQQRYLSICESHVDDPVVLTSTYSNFVICTLGVSKAMGGHQSIHLVIPVILNGMGFSAYFNSSFWNEGSQYQPVSKILWKVREELGKKFTDKLVAAAVNTARDDPAEVLTENFNGYLIRSLKMADYITDSECAKWPRIQQALEESGMSHKSILAQNPNHVAMSTACSEKWKM